MGNWFRSLPTDAMESDLFRRLLDFFSWIHVFDLKTYQGVDKGYYRINKIVETVGQSGQRG